MTELTKFYVAKVITYDYIEYSTGTTECNYNGEYFPEIRTQKVITNIQTYAAGPEKKDVINLFYDLIEKWYSKEEADEAKEILLQDKEYDKPEKGYAFKIDETLALDIVHVL